MASPFDYSSFLPGELELALRALTKTYINAVERLNSAYLQSPLPGVYTTAPNIIGAKNLTFDVALRSLPSIRDFVAYAQLLVTVVPAISDRETLVDTLLPIASTWNKLDVSDLSIVDEKYKEIFTSYLPTLDPIVEGLKIFLSELENVDKSNPPEWFTQTLFDTLAPILSFASFRPGVEGQSTLASILGLPLKTVSTPLNRVLFPLLPVKPDPKQVIADAIQNHLIDAIVNYRHLLEGLIPLFTPFAAACSSVSKEQAAVVPRMEADDPGAEPVTASQCIAAWNGVKDAANAFIDYLAASPSASSGRQSIPKAADAPKSIPPGDVTAAFGPPQTASETLPEMSATTGQIVANFNKILTLPFIDQLKVTDIAGAETSVDTVMLACKKKYETLQGVTVDIVRDLNAYGLLQEVILPVVNSPDGLSLEEFLQTNLPLVMKYGKDAQKIAADTKALLDEFEGWLDVLNKNLDEINKSIADNQAALDQAQKEYDAAKAGAIIEGILGVVFTAVAIASLAVGQGALAVSMGVSAGSSFALMIRDAVNAGQLAIVIGNLKNVIATSETTRDQLKIVIPLFNTIITLMGTIHTVWETISSDLSDVQSQYALWNNPAYFTPQAIQGALDNWRDVIVQCQKYISIVAGGSTSYAKEYKRAQEKLTGGVEPPPPYEDAILPGYETILGQDLSPADRVGRYRAVAKAVDINRLTAALSPPGFTLGVNRSQLNSAADSYRWVASTIRDLYSDSAADADRLANTITNKLMPSLDKAIAFYITFAAGQENPFSKGTSEAAMQSLIEERWEQLKQGTGLAQTAETDFINFRNDSQSALNTLTRHLNELNANLAAKEATLRDLQAEYDKWSWVIWWPFPPGIGAIIYVIIDSITQTTAEINRLRNEISKINSAQARVVLVQQISADVGRMTSTLSQSWSQLTSKTQELETLVHAIVITPEVEQAILPVVQASWQAFSNELKRW